MPPLNREIVARCGVRYTGRLTATLPEATRLLVFKADGSVLGPWGEPDDAARLIAWLCAPTTPGGSPAR
jgi:RecB family endonuclease NucS